MRFTNYYIVLLFFGWLSFLIYGTILFRASECRKTGITLITLFFLIIFVLITSLFEDENSIYCETFDTGIELCEMRE